MKTCIQTLGILALAASLSYAEDAPKKGDKKAPDPAKMFAKLDTNSDGSLSLEEFKASPRGKKDEAKAAEIFAKMDADSKDGVSLEEFKAFVPEKGKGHGKGKKKGQ